MKDIPKCKACATTFKSASDKVMCTFCAYACCNQCTKKSRPYPKSGDGQTSTIRGYQTIILRKKRGEICKECDRKFFVKEQVESQHKEIDVNKASMQ